MEKIIKFENVDYSCLDSGGGINSSNKRKYALKNINICVNEGEFLAIMGENGSGKTTFCRLINGIIPHSLGGLLCGNVIIDGINTKETDIPHLALKAGLASDDSDTQLFTSTVFHEAAFGPENILMPADEIRQRVTFALNAVGLNGFEDRNPATLSEGEKQRLVIASVISMTQKILVLDEALSRLDENVKKEILCVISSLRKKCQLTVVMATHDSKLALDYADKVCLLKNGSVAAFGASSEILKDKVLLEDCGVQYLFSKIEKFQNMKSMEDAKKTVIEFKNVNFSYGEKKLLFNINLTVNEGDFTAITGPNGCGKTTLLKIITGLLKPDSGKIFINGKNFDSLSISGIAKEIGFVMQNPDHQLFSDSVYNEVSFALKNSGLGKNEIKNRTLDAIKKAGLDNLDDINIFPHSLCKADRTKVVLACVLAMGCKIIILDEIDAGQDYKSSLKIMNTIKELNSHGYTIIFVTHNMSLVHEYAKNIIDGRNFMPCNI